MTSRDERHADTVAWLVTDGIWHPLLFVPPSKPTAYARVHRKISAPRVDFHKI